MILAPLFEKDEKLKMPQLPGVPVGGMPNVRSYVDIGYQIVWWLTELQWGKRQKFVAQSHAQSCFLAD